MTAYIKSNLQEIKEKMSKSAELVGKSLDDLTLIGITKYATTEQIAELYRLGVTNIGENKVQDALPKIEELEDLEINWHFVGHLQSNKVKYLINHISLYQALDRTSLAKELHKRADKNNVNVNALVQINIAGDENKFGLSQEETEHFIEKVLNNYPRINIKGLMTMPPYFSEPEQVRPYYSRMRELFELFKTKFGEQHFQYLSMGMSHDYHIAIEEGANMVRVGRSLFTQREEG
ncbi:YggS family pyridoxal phosphate-dependent enzyme [Natranaerobius thermophilus]|uniref:Pyridoxal phosphate homeostasis protein n=1 Tax=Natranaerobius thermophilus (strain ATCC BAA-1301 / DSM 18059 / JW/NM-WN-LF) TaxID=457570 RepID=B2A2I3_NATTJ|nr:YggS family pyridoxal phosphate-dependent enzyme [Natranaerobius thermophilus]ACB84898.1 alanine racemase domain protein [Natranaerobius thermophilus JW/NM-WN-LF]